MKQSKIKIYLSESTNPWFNLATEEWLLRELHEQDQALFLWRNQDAVVIGRSQNPWVECHLEAMQKDAVQLARRQSGGGAVFHDLGNTNFTFVAKKASYDRQQNFQIILRALARLNIDAQLSGRNDLVVCDQEGLLRKISGSAFRETHDRAFHHGTLLRDVDLAKLQRYLTPHPKKLAAKGVQSVRARVINLIELNPKIAHETLCDVLIAEYCQTHGVEITTEKLNPDALDYPVLQQFYAKMQTWEWLYGETLDFTHEFSERFVWGLIDIQLQVKNAKIVAARVYSDSLNPEWIDAIEQSLPGLNYQPEALTHALLKLKQQFPHLNQETEELVNWLKTQLH